MTLSLAEAREQLIAAGITGTHRSHSRRSTLDKLEPLIAGDPDKTFGIPGLERFTPREVLSFMAELTGCSSDIECLDDDDFIDPHKTIAGVVNAAERLADHARSGGTLLAVTGHPTGMLELYIRIVDAFADAGGKVVRLREEEQLEVGRRGSHSEIRYVGSVGCLADWGSLKHTHLPHAMEALLDGRTWPDLVLGDHGFAGAAIARGIPTIAIMDINDHALAAAWAAGADVTIVPLDDNRPPGLYEPVWRLCQQILAGSPPA